MHYGENLMFLKDRNSLTNVKMSQIIGTSDSLYSRYEKQKEIIPIKHLDTFSNHFDVSIDYIFGFINIKNYKTKNSLIDKTISSKRLKEFRKEFSLTQQALAEILNTKNSNISKYECGKQIITTSHLYMLCKKYQLSADYLLGKTNKPKFYS